MDSPRFSSSDPTDSTDDRCEWCDGSGIDVVLGEPCEACSGRCDDSPRQSSEPAQKDPPLQRSKARRNTTEACCSLREFVATAASNPRHNRKNRRCKSANDATLSSLSLNTDADSLSPVSDTPARPRKVSFDVRISEHFVPRYADVYGSRFDLSDTQESIMEEQYPADDESKGVLLVGSGGGDEN